VLYVLEAVDSVLLCVSVALVLCLACYDWIRRPALEEMVDVEEVIGFEEHWDCISIMRGVYVALL
jgi:hypothetical protein